MLNKFLSCQSTSLSHTESLYLFFTLGPLSRKSNYKQFFDTIFINSCPHARNHATKEIDLSFEKCGDLIPINFNQSWQLKLLDCKSVCIIKAISLTAALFWNPLFAPYPYQTMKLSLKPGLRMRSITNGAVKKRIEAVWANITIY